MHYKRGNNVKHRLEMELSVGRWLTLRLLFWELILLRKRQTEQEIIGVKRIHEKGKGRWERFM